MVEKKSEKKEKIVKKASKSDKMSSYGSIIFGVGLLIAIVGSFLTNLSATPKTILGVTLIVLGIVIGVLNITNKEIIPFLLATIVLIVTLQPFLMTIAQAFKISDQFVLQVIGTLFGNVMLLVVPAAIFVALKVIFLITKDE